MHTDGELLRQYAEDGSEQAFAELVQRHINVVYRAALRRLGGDAHAADDVTQRVFTDLARKARQLADRPNLAGWLYTGTRFMSAQYVRGEQRRRVREQEAHHMDLTPASSHSSPVPVEPVLDELLDLLPERDREAVVLHCLEGQTFAEVGAALSLSADATRMRVNRALEQLRVALQRRGVASTAAALAGALSAQSALAAPAGLAAKVAAVAVRDAAAVSTAVVTAKTLWALGATVVVGAAVALWYFSGESADIRAAMDLEPVVESGSIRAADAGMVLAATQVPPVVGGGAEGEGLLSPRFSDTTVEERNLLKQFLWLRDDMGERSPLTYGLNLTAAHPNAAGMPLLVSKGLVTRVTEQHYRLSARGTRFIEENRDAILAHRITKGPATPPFPQLPEPERRLLKLLWKAYEKAGPPPPGKIFGIPRDDDLPGMEAVDPLVEQGVVIVTQQKGLVCLTRYGVSYCRRSARHIEAFDPGGE